MDTEILDACGNWETDTKFGAFYKKFWLFLAQTLTLPTLQMTPITEPLTMHLESCTLFALSLNRTQDFMREKQEKPFLNV